VSDCCTPKGYLQIFSEKIAAGEAKRYRRKGLDGTSKRIFDFWVPSGHWAALTPMRVRIWRGTAQRATASMEPNGLPAG
jgi:hypothetical protein